MENLISQASTFSLKPFSLSYSTRIDMRQLLHRCAQLCSVLLVLLGIAVLFGWLFQIEALMTVLPGRVSMKANTAFSFLGCGLALYLSLTNSRAGRILSLLFAGVIVFLASLTLAEYASHLDLHIDQLLLRDTHLTIDPGRMARITAINFCVSGVSLILWGGGHLLRRISQVLALLVTSSALASIVGYVYGVPVLYGSFSSANSMALHTGIGFLILGFGIVISTPDSMIGRLLSSSGPGSWLARRMLPLVVMLPILLGYWYSHPAINFGQLRFGMALFAVTLVFAGAIGLLQVGNTLNRTAGQQQELIQTRLDAAAAVEASERELRLVTDHLPTLISYIDPSGRFLRVNSTYEKWLGQPADRIIGSTIRELLGEEYWNRTKPLREPAGPGLTRSIETVYPTLQGDRRVVVIYAPDFDESGSHRGFACMVIDVDEQRRAESALRDSERFAAVGRLASSIAHEINNPVDAVMSLVYLAREQSNDFEVKAMLQTAEGELKRVASIANETLRFHRQSENRELVYAADLFSSVLTLHSSRLLKQAVRVERRDRATVAFPCGEGEIRQVLNNLVANAIDAMMPGGRLILRSRSGEDWATGRHGVIMTIADNGSGMDKQTLARVFEAFYTTKGKNGSGIGLWISAEILGRHQGYIRIRSNSRSDTHGSVFRIFLPTSISTA